MVWLSHLQSKPAAVPRQTRPSKKLSGSKLPNGTDSPTSNHQQLLSVLVLRMRARPIWFCISVKVYYNSSWASDSALVLSDSLVVCSLEEEVLSSDAESVVFDLLSLSVSAFVGFSTLGFGLGILFTLVTYA